MFLKKKSINLLDFKTCFSNLLEIQYPNKDADENTEKDAKKYAISSDKLSIAEEILRLYYPSCDVIQSGKDFEKLTNSELESLRQAVYLFIKENEIKSPSKHILSFLIRSIVYNLEETEKLAPKARHGVEYNGGVTAYNVLVALCYDDRVIFCLDLNYLDYINCKDDFIPLLDIESEEIDVNSIFKENINIKISSKKATCDVILTSEENCKTKVVSYLRTDKEITRRRARKLVESTNKVIYSDIPQNKANKIKKDLEKLGAIINIEKHYGNENN